MLNENLKIIRKEKGMSQEELANKLNVVRQTVSKWEQGLSVPDSEMLIKISEIFEVPVSRLIGETIEESTVRDELAVISRKLENINAMLAQSSARKKRKNIIAFSVFLIIVAVIIIAEKILEFFAQQIDNISVGVIGGADGPTSIIVAPSTTFSWVTFIFSLVVAAAMIAGAIILIRRARK